MTESSIEIREGTLEELCEVNQRIAEFTAPYSRGVIVERLKGRKWYGLVAVSDRKLVGFKLGYSLDDHTFYSWIGGVVAEARGNGIARKLLHAQENWASRQGFCSLRVKSRNRFRAMLQLLLTADYDIVATEQKGDVADYRIHFLKKL